MNLEVSMSTLSERKYVYTRPLILAVDLRHTFEGGGYGPNHPHTALSIQIYFFRDTSACKGFVWSKSDESCNLGDIVDPGLAGTKLVFIRLGGLNHFYITKDNHFHK